MHRRWLIVFLKNIIVFDESFDPCIYLKILLHQLKDTCTSYQMYQYWGQFIFCNQRSKKKVHKYSIFCTTQATPELAIDAVLP